MSDVPEYILEMPNLDGWEFGEDADAVERAWKRAARESLKMLILEIFDDATITLEESGRLTFSSFDLGLVVGFDDAELSDECLGWYHCQKKWVPRGRVDAAKRYFERGINNG